MNKNYHFNLYHCVKLGMLLLTLQQGQHIEQSFDINYFLIYEFISFNSTNPKKKKKKKKKKRKKKQEEIVNVLVSKLFTTKFKFHVFNLSNCNSI